MPDELLAPALKWVDDPADQEVQEVLISVGVTEANWREADPERRRKLRDAARLICNLHDILVRAAGSSWGDAREMQDRALSFLGGMEATFRKSVSNRKGDVRALNRSWVARVLPAERQFLLEELKAVRSQVRAQRSAASVRGRVQHLAEQVNRNLIDRFGRTALQIRPDDIEGLLTETPKMVARRIFRWRRFPGLLSDDDVAGAQIRRPRSRSKNSR